MHWNASSMNQNLGLYASYPSSRQTNRTASPSIGSESIMSPSFKERGGNGSKDILNIMAMIIIFVIYTITTLGLHHFQFQHFSTHSITTLSIS